MEVSKLSIQIIRREIYYNPNKFIPRENLQLLIIIEKCSYWPLIRKCQCHEDIQPMKVNISLILKHFLKEIILELSSIESY